MKKFIIAFLIVPLFLVYSQTPDTIVVKTNRIKGFGPFPMSVSPLKTMSKDNPWINSIPEIKGLPNDYSKMMFCTEQTDFLQHTFQSYFNNKISEELYNGCKSSWSWEPKPNEYNKDFVKVDIAILAYIDSLGNTKVKIDRNNNYDLSDDEWYTIPPKLPGQNFWGRYNDLLPIEVEYESFDGREIIKCHTWIYIDISPFTYNIKSGENNQLELSYAFAEHHFGEFTFNNEEYSLALKSGRAAIRNDYKIKVWRNKSEDKQSGFDEGVGENELIRLGDFYYKIINATIDGSKVTLIKISDIETTGGSQVGLIAPLFKTESIKGDIVNIELLKGNYILLDFWGTWCGPCRGEIPKLKEIYDKYSKNNFVMIGIANDNIEDLKSYVEKNDIKWSQVIQDRDKQIINLYTVKSYPTTFLINPDGKIIEKNIRAYELDNKLKEIFKN